LGTKSWILKNTYYEKIYLIINLFFVLAMLIACSNDGLDFSWMLLAAPSNISALTTVTQDNTGKAFIA